MNQVYPSLATQQLALFGTFDAKLAMPGSMTFISSKYLATNLVSGLMSKHATVIISIELKLFSV